MKKKKDVCNLAKKIRDLIKTNEKVKNFRGDLKKHAEGIADVMQGVIDEEGETEQILLDKFVAFFGSYW